MTAMTGANGRHDRFRELAATALDFPLTTAEAAELAVHLATCPACARLAGGLRVDAAALRRPAELATSYRLDTAVGAAIAGRRAPGQASRTLLLVAATALLGAALLGAAAVGAYLWRTLNPQLVVDPSPPVSNASPAPSGDPGPAVPAFTWQLGSIAPMVEGRDAAPVAVGGGDAGFVAVGGRFFLDNVTPSGSTASAWRSEDGLAWKPAATDGLALGGSIPIDDEPTPGIADVAWGPAGWVAVGIDIDGNGNRFGAAWHSTGGAAWTRLSFPDAARVRPAAVAWNGSTYVVVGTVRSQDAPRAAAWLSADGRSWERVPDGDAFDIGGYIQYYSASGSGGLADLAAGAEGSLVAVGHACTGTTSPEDRAVCHPVALRSPDGESWSVVTGPDLTGLGLASVAARGTRFVAVVGGPGALGYIQAPGQVGPGDGAGRIALGDATGWQVFEPAGVPALDRVITLGDWYLAVSSAGNRIRLWASPDGEAWAEVPGIPQPSVAPEHEPDIAAFSDVDLAVAGGRVVITGRNQADPVGSTIFAIVGTSATNATTPSPAPSAAPLEEPALEVGVITPVNLNSAGVTFPALGERAPTVADRGAVVAFESGSPGSGSMVLVRDVGSATTTVANVRANGSVSADTAWRPSISADGRHLAFDSWSADLVQGDTNEAQDVFIRDLLEGTTIRVSVAEDGGQAAEGGWLAALSSDGTTVAFASSSPDLIPEDTNRRSDVFVRDLRSGELSRVSVATGGTEANGESTQPAISADGRFVAFYSAATNLVKGDTNGVLDLFVHDRATGETTRASVASDGTQGNGHAGPATSCVTGSTGPARCSAGTPPSLSRDGKLIVFASDATNLVDGDLNAVADVFLHDRVTGETVLLSRSSDGIPCDGMSYEPVISADGAVVAFTSGATNLVADDTNGDTDVFVLNRRTGSLHRASTGPTGQAGGGSKPGLSPDGTVLAFITADDAPGAVVVRLPDPGG